MSFFLQILVSGVATGAIYALIAVGYSMTFMTMGVLNFALGMWVMLGGMLTFTLFGQWKLNIFVTIVIVVAVMAGLGVLAERLTVRPFLRAGSEAWIMSTLSLGLLFIDFSELLWGRNPLPVPSFVGEDALHFGAVAIYPQQLLIIVTTIIVFFILDYFYYKTIWGKAFRAVAHSRETASLMGINPRWIAVVAYALAGGLAGFAGLIIVPLTLADPEMGTVLGLKAFAIAIIAGLGAPRGILICGLAYGAFEDLVSGYLFTGIRDIVGFSLMIVLLFLKPQGLFGRAGGERA